MHPETHVGRRYRCWDPVWRLMPPRYKRKQRKRSHKADRRYGRVDVQERLS